MRQSIYRRNRESDERQDKRTRQRLTARSYANLRSFGARKQNGVIFLYGIKSSYIDRDPHRYTRRVKEAIHIRLHSNNINRDSGIEIPEAWIPTIRKHNSRSTRRRTYEGTSSVSRNNNEDRNAPITANQRA